MEQARIPGNTVSSCGFSLQELLTDSKDQAGLGQQLLPMLWYWSEKTIQKVPSKKTREFVGASILLVQ